MQDWVKSPRILAIIEKQSEYALFIFNYQAPIAVSNDVSLSNAIAIDAEFSCDPGELRVVTQIRKRPL